MGVIRTLNARMVGGGSDRTPEMVVADLARDMEIRVPMKDIPILADEVHPETYAVLQGTTNMNSLGVFIKQETERFNMLLWEIRRSLKQLQLAIKGLVAMGQDLEAMFNALILLRVPPKWQA